jgi:hypothetical protein
VLASATSGNKKIFSKSGDYFTANLEKSKNRKIEFLFKQIPYAGGDVRNDRRDDKLTSRRK